MSGYTNQMRSHANNDSDSRLKGRKKHPKPLVSNSCLAELSISPHTVSWHDGLSLLSLERQVCVLEADSGSRGMGA